jgi:hypothetical protein
MTANRALFTLFAVVAVGAVGAVGALLFIAKPQHPAAPDYRTVALGGLQYEAMLSRPVHPSHTVDAPIAAGLRSSDRRQGRGQMLFGAFIAVANDSLHGLPAARRIELRDDGGNVYRPLRLPASNPYAYAPRRVPPKTRIPGFGTPADRNLAATGRLLLFRIPAGAYEDGVLELVIHDPRAPARVAYLRV